MKNTLLCIGLILSGFSIHAQSAKGYVFNDTNGNGKKDASEKGIENVGVCNGVLVTKTDKNGLYQLPVGKDNIIFVIKPGGYQVKSDENNLPKYYYIHKPEGSPALKYKGVAPTGPLPASIDFALKSQPEEENFTALIFGDPQPYTETEVQHFAKGVVTEVEGIKQIAFGLSLGDLVGDNLDLHLPYIQSVKKIGLPWYNLMGNHDMDYDAKSDSLSDDTYEAHFGPANYAFNYGKAHFIILDDIVYPDPRDQKGYWGGFRKDQLDFVENDLKHVSKDQLVILAYHIPLETEGESYRLEDRKRLFDILKDFPNVFTISAHTHLQRQNFFTAEHGWAGAKPLHEYNAGTTSGDWYSGELNEMGVPVSTMRDGTPKGYAFLKIKGNQYSIDYKVVGKPADYQMEIFAPKVIPSQRGTSAGIFANFFMGHKSNVVEYRIDETPWKPMVFVEDEDPTYLNSLFKWDTSDKLLSGRRPSNAVKSTHLWRGSFVPNLTEGEHFIEVKATDMFGKTTVQKKAFLVEKQ